MSFQVFQCNNHNRTYLKKKQRKETNKYRLIVSVLAGNEPEHKYLFWPNANVIMGVKLGLLSAPQRPST